MAKRYKYAWRWRQWRKIRRLTHEEFAKAIGLSVRTVKGIQYGEIKRPCRRSVEAFEDLKRRYKEAEAIARRKVVW